MTSSDVTALRRSDLNPFLFADIGTEANGMILSVLSLLARQGTDPWREAGRLAGLPRAEAAESLARAIATMPLSAWSLPDAAPIAGRLIGLLPERSPAGAVAETVRAALPWPLRRIVLVAACAALVALFALASLGWMGSPARPDDDRASLVATPAGAQK